MAYEHIAIVDGRVLSQREYSELCAHGAVRLESGVVVVKDRHALARDRAYAASVIGGFVEKKR